MTELAKLLAWATDHGSLGILGAACVVLGAVAVFFYRELRTERRQYATTLLDLTVALLRVVDATDDPVDQLLKQQAIESLRGR